MSSTSSSVFCWASVLDQKTCILIRNMYCTLKECVKHREIWNLIIIQVQGFWFPRPPPLSPTLRCIQWGSDHKVTAVPPPWRSKTLVHMPRPAPPLLLYRPSQGKPTDPANSREGGGGGWGGCRVEMEGRMEGQTEGWSDGWDGLQRDTS